MNTFITGDIWQKINKRLKTNIIKKASIAYVTRSNLKLAKGDELVCDASVMAIKSGMTSAKVIKEYYNKGVIIYSNSALHSKFMVMDDLLVVGSANLSQSSGSSLIETAIITNDAAAISQAKAFFFKLSNEESTTQILDKDGIEKLLKIKVKRSFGYNGGKPKIRTIELGENTWFIKVYPLGERAEQIEEKEDDNIREGLAKSNKLDEDTIEYVRWPIKTTFGKLGKEGDRILVRSHNSDGSKSRVLPPSTILKRVKKGKYIYFYYLADDTRDISFTEFSKHIKSLSKKIISFNKSGMIDNDLFDNVSSIWMK